MTVKPVHLVWLRRSKNGSVVRAAVCGEVLPYSVAEAEIEPVAYPHVSAFELTLRDLRGREELIGLITCTACRAALVQEALEAAG